MRDLVSRVLLGASAAMLAFAGLAHGSAFPRAQAAARASDLAPFFVSGFQILWLVDVATSLGLAMVFALTAVRPAVTSRLVIGLLSLMPLSTASFLITFAPGFYAGPWFVAAGGAALLASVIGVSARRLLPQRA